jgi:TonB family protein
MKLVSALIVVFLLALSASAKDPVPYLKSAPRPFYSRLSRVANVQGTVRVRFVVNENGDTSDVQALSGHPMLQDIAIQNVQSWKFGWANPCYCRVKQEVEFVFSISSEWVDDNGPDSIVKWYGKSPVTRVEIQAGGVTVQP